MTTSATPDESVRTWQVRSAASWIALAASPSFALMALVTAADAQGFALCSSSPAMPSSGMTAMYLLMSLFHLPPWLTLASKRPWART